MLRKLIILPLLLMLSLAGCGQPLAPFATQSAPPTVEARAERREATATPQAAASPVPSLTATQSPTATPTLEAAPTLDPATATPEATPFEPLYSVQPGSPKLTGNFMQPDAGCGWIEVSGQVFDADQKPISELLVEISGELNGEEITLLGMTGANNAIGPGGYGITLSQEPIEGGGVFQARVLDLEAQPLADPVSFHLSTDCEKNLVVLNFVPAYEMSQVFIPLAAQETGEE